MLHLLQVKSLQQDVPRKEDEDAWMMKESKHIAIVEEGYESVEVLSIPKYDSSKD